MPHHRHFDGLGPRSVRPDAIPTSWCRQLAMLRSPERTRLLHVFRYRRLSPSIPECTRPVVFAGQTATHRWRYVCQTYLGPRHGLHQCHDPLHLRAGICLANSYSRTTLAVTPRLL